MSDLLRMVIFFMPAINLALPTQDLENGKSEVPDLRALLQTIEAEVRCFPKRSESVLGITELGKQAVPELIQRVQLLHKTWKAPVRYAYLLAMIGPDAKAALPCLERMSEDPKSHRYVKTVTSFATASIREDYPALVQLASDGEIGWQIALDILSFRGTAAKTASGPLAGLARKPGGRSRYFLETLQSVDPKLAGEIAKERASRE